MLYGKSRLFHAAHWWGLADATSARRSSHCYDTLVMTASKPQCAHCDTLLDKKKPSVELKREGTGFAAGGQVEAKRVSARWLHSSARADS